MKQPEIEITDDTGKEWGIFPVTSLNWNKGKLYALQVDWYKSDRDPMPMWDYNGTGEFTNHHGNLKGKLIS